MGLDFLKRAAGEPERIAIFPAAFNPPTLAHAALARAAQAVTDEVLLILPRTFPHKPYEGASFEERARMLLTLAEAEARWSIGSVDDGLFISIAAECRAKYGEHVDLMFVCGRDAAERIRSWDYGEPGVFDRMLERFEMLVASRHGDFVPEPHHVDRIRPVRLPPSEEAISSTVARELARTGAALDGIVPEAIQDMVYEIYRA